MVGPLVSNDAVLLQAPELDDPIRDIIGKLGPAPEQLKNSENEECIISLESAKGKGDGNDGSFAEHGVVC